MLLPALARRPSALAQPRVQMRPGILENRNRSEQQAGKHRNPKRKQQHRQINPDLMHAWQSRRRHRHQHLQRPVCQRQSQQTPQHSQYHTLEHQLYRNPSPPRAQRRAYRQLLPPPIHAHHQQIRHVRASNQQHHRDRPHQDPQHLANISHHILLQRSQVRRDARLLKQRHAESIRRRKTTIRDRQHARHVRARLCHRHSRFQARHRLVAEVSQFHLAAVPLERHHQRGILIIQKVKSLRQHSNNFPRLSVHRNGFPDHRRCPAKFLPPVSVRKQHRIRRPRRIIFAREQSSQRWPHSQHRQSPIRHVEASHLLRFSRARHTQRVAVIRPDVLERGVLLAINKIIRRRHIQVRNPYGRRRVPHSNQLLRMRIRQRFQQHSLQHAEYHRVRPHAHRQCDQRDNRKQRRPPQSSQHLPQLIAEHSHLENLPTRAHRSQLGQLHTHIPRDLPCTSWYEVNQRNVSSPRARRDFDFVAAVFRPPSQPRAPFSRVSHGRGAACESPYRAIHPESPQCGIEGLRPSLPRCQPHRLLVVDVAFLCALCTSWHRQSCLCSWVF